MPHPYDTKLMEFEKRKVLALETIANELKEVKVLLEDQTELLKDIQNSK
jgi:hypothetical protein